MVWPGYELYISLTIMAHVHKTETENLSQRRDERLLRERESSRNRERLGYNENAQKQKERDHRLS